MKNSGKSDFVSIRSFLFSNVQNILDNLNAQRNDSKIDSDDLFGFDEEAPKHDLNWQYDFTPKSEYEVLLEEKESLGLYVSGNPLNNYKELLDWVRSATYMDDIELILVEKIKKIFTRSGSMMLALQLTTSSDSMEGLIFSKNALKFSAILEEKQLYWCLGSVKQKAKKAEVETESSSSEIKEYDEKPKLMISEVVPFSKGILSLLSAAEVEVAQNRREFLEKVNWVKLQTNPDISNLEKITNDNSKNQTSKTLSLRLPKTLGAESLKEIKEHLIRHYRPGYQELLLFLEISDGWKKARGEFWANKDFVANYKKYIET
jgi:DNA polymerase III alpha subunit